MTPPTPREPSPDEMRRLALVRRLYDLGLDQSRSATPAGSLALLSFHDAVELFLLLAAERHGVGGEKTTFMEHFKLLGDAGLALTQRESMRRLNHARVSLKHKGLLPASSDLEGFRAATTNFFGDNCPVALGVEFGRISMTGLVKHRGARELLERAEGALATGDHAEALGQATLAFHKLLRDHRTRGVASVPAWRAYSLRDAVGLRFTSFDARDLERGLPREAGRAAGNLGGMVLQIADSYAEAITVVGYGLDFGAYLLFKSETPVVQHFIGGDTVVEWLREPTSHAETVQRCVGFVVDAALRIGSEDSAEGE